MNNKLVVKSCLKKLVVKSISVNLPTNLLCYMRVDIIISLHVGIKMQNEKIKGRITIG